MSLLRKFKYSSLELSKIQCIAVCAMMLALRVILGIFTNFTLAVMPFVKIGFSFIPIVITAYLYGPVCAAIVSGAGDVLSLFLSNPTAFSLNPLLTLCYVWEGILYGLALYQTDYELKNIIIAKAAALGLCALPLNTIILSGMMNIPYHTLLLYRAAVLVPFSVVEVLIMRFIKQPLDRIMKYNRNPVNKTEIKTNQENYSFQYIISFIVPLVGYILGAILLSKDSGEKKAVGKTCIVLAIVSSIIISIIMFSILK